MYMDIPQIKSDLEVGTLGYYEYRSCLICVFGGLSNNKVLMSGEFPESIPSKQLIIGNIFHNLMDFARKCSEKSELIFYANQLFVQTEREYFDFIKNNKLGSIKSWSEVGNSLRAAINSVSKAQSLFENNSSLLVSKNNRFRGVPDLYVINGDEVFIREYKSSSLFIDGEIKEEYIDQVKYYAYLIYDNCLELKSFKCEIKSLKGEFFEVFFSQSDLSDYGSQINTSYISIQNALSRSNNFEFDNCIRCSKKVVCDEYISKTKAEDIRHSQPVFVLKGVVSSVLSKDSSNLLIIDAHEIIFNGIFDVGNTFKIGHKYVIYNLIKANRGYLYTSLSGFYGR